MRSTSITLLAALAMVVVLTGTAGAGSILYLVDDNQGTDQMAAALADPAITVNHTVTTAADETDFLTKLNSGAFDLAILCQQLDNDLNGALDVVEGFVAGGGRAIVTDWRREDSYVDGHEAAWTGNRNDPSVTLTDARTSGASMSSRRTTATRSACGTR